MSTASRPRNVRIRSGDVVTVRQIQPDDAPALVRAYADLGEQSRYRRFFTAMPELPDHMLKAAVEVDHENHEALVATPPRSSEILAESRFIRSQDRQDTADVGVTVVDEWQGRGLGSALLACLSERALEVGVRYFTAEVLAENRTMLGLLSALGAVETSTSGPVVCARVEIAEPPQPPAPDLLALLFAAARGEIVSLPVLLRRLVRVPEEVTHIVQLPVTGLLAALRSKSSAA
jgi:RimJ/RimL family protein N-acetyltransferase